MRRHASFRKRLGLNSDDAIFTFFMTTLKDRLVTPDYLVNWEKVVANTRAIEMALHQLDFILGKADIATALFDVIKQHKHVVAALPAVLASRECRFALSSTSSRYLEIESYLLTPEIVETDDDIHKIVEFCRVVGLLDFVAHASIRSFVDFVYGVEVGLDSNGRKNRGGKQMEVVVDNFLQTICQKHNLTYISQATNTKIKHTFGKDIILNKTNSIIDFVVRSKATLFFIETNFYGSSGSKLKATAKEYQGLYTSVSKHPHCQFVWITDGKGWQSTKAILRETFDVTDYILNLEMLAKGILEDILTS